MSTLQDLFHLCWAHYTPKGGKLQACSVKGLAGKVEHWKVQPQAPKPAVETGKDKGRIQMRPL
jgi:hypothetical protein